jgi:hypothetical protein
MVDVILLLNKDMKGMVGPADFWDMKRNFQFNFLLCHGLKSHHALLDFGCGNLRGGLPLIRYLESTRYTGLDTRKDVLLYGERSIREAGLCEKKPCLVNNHDGLVDIKGAKFDYIWAFSVLIHIPDEQLLNVLQSLTKHMHESSVFYANVNIGFTINGMWKEFPCITREWQFYEDAFRKSGLTFKDIGSLLDHGHFHPRLSPETQARQRILRFSIDPRRPVI